MEVGEFLRRIEALDLSQAEFARQVGNRRASVSAWKARGRVPDWVEFALSGWERSRRRGEPLPWEQRRS